MITQPIVIGSRCFGAKGGTAASRYLRQVVMLVVSNEW